MADDATDTPGSPVDEYDRMSTELAEAFDAHWREKAARKGEAPPPPRGPRAAFEPVWARPTHKWIENKTITAVEDVEHPIAGVRLTFDDGSSIVLGSDTDDTFAWEWTAGDR
jgi:hypothetical protein